MAPLVALLPAAGLGSRFVFPASIKELHPIRVRPTAADAASEMRPVCHFALAAAVRAGAERCAVVISPGKTDMRQALGSAFGRLPLSYIVQTEPRGVPNAVAAAASWLGESDVLLAFPDTVHFPDDALGEVQRQRVHDRADVMLGVFPVSSPEELGPVDFMADGTVVRIYDKPRTGAIANTWGVASWSARFTAFCVDWDTREARHRTVERSLGDTFEAAHRAGLRVRARFFPSGAYGDIGTPAGLSESIAILRRRGLVADDIP